MIGFIKALLQARKNQKLAETRYKELSQLRRELIEMRLERDYWQQRFQGFEVMMKAKPAPVPPPFNPK